MSVIKKGAILVLLACCALSLPSRFKQLTYGFKLEKLQLSMPFASEWEVDPVLSEQELDAILSQPFSFLGKGAQSYVFESQDQQVVLKLFRFDHRQNRLLDRWQWEGWQEEKAIALFNACLLGWKRAREETALLYLHLNPTTGQLPILTAKTPLGRTLPIELDRVRFVLQRKVVPLDVAFEQAVQDGTLSMKVDALQQLLKRRTEKKIGNRDPSLWRNFGFLGDQAVEIDFGNYVDRPDFEQEVSRQKEMEKYLRILRKWLTKRSI